MEIKSSLISISIRPKSMRSDYFWSFVGFLLFIMPQTGSADWFCTEGASKRTGKTLLVCGIGEATTESDARSLALKDAYREFSGLCDPSPDCNNFEISINPLRNDCAKSKKTGFKCYRALQVEITKRGRDSSVPRQLPGDGTDVYIQKNVIEIPASDLSKAVKLGIVKFQSIPVGATVEIDGARLCETPCSKELTYGKHQTVFRLDDYNQTVKEILVSDTRSEVKATLEPSVGHLIFEDLPEQTLIKVDGKQVLNTTSIKVTQSEYVVELLNPHYFPDIHKVSVSKGEEKVIGFTGRPKNGLLSVSASDGNGNAIAADIFIDGKSLGKGTPTTLELIDGKHSVRLEALGLIYTGSVSIEYSKVTALKAKLNSSNGEPLCSIAKGRYIRENHGCREVVNSDDSDLLNKAMDAYNSAHFNDAAKIFSRYLEIDGPAVGYQLEAVYFRGESYRQMGDTVQGTSEIAKQNYQKALHDYSDFLEVWNTFEPPSKSIREELNKRSVEVTNIKIPKLEKYISEH